MARKSAEGIVLRTRPLGEADLLVTFLTPTEGKISGAAKSARRSRRRFGGALEPMTHGRATWTENEGREIVRLESFEVSASFAQRQADLPWFYLFAYLAEVADTFARDREADPRFYRLLSAATGASTKGMAPGVVRRWFEIWTLRLQGLLPDFDACSTCGAPMEGADLVVAVESGGAFDVQCARSEPGAGERIRLTRDEATWIRTALARPVARMPEPGASAGLDRLVRRLFLQFTGAPFRSTRFLEGP